MESTCLHCDQAIYLNPDTDTWVTLDGNNACPASLDPATWGIHEPELTPTERWQEMTGILDTDTKTTRDARMARGPKCAGSGIIVSAEEARTALGGLVRCPGCSMPMLTRWDPHERRLVDHLRALPAFAPLT
jgi:hypothetical protein